MVRDKKSTPLNKVIARGAFGAQLTLRQLGYAADVYYPAFWLMENRPSNILILNREKVRVRVINGGASTSFWMTFGGWPSTCFIRRPWRTTSCQNKTFIGVSETYFIVTIPEDGKIEYRIMAQDQVVASAFRKR
jgi:hypothetical protein